jgi:drug/metabolite transporter (DMT)-like permease
MTLLGWPLGLFLSALSSIFGIGGKLFLKLAHNEKEREEELEQERGYAVPSSRVWYMYFYAGLASMLVMNPALGSVAYCFASQSLLAPMAGLTIGWNTLFGPLLLPHERLTTNDFIGAVLIFAGCVLVGISGPHKTPPMPVDGLWRCFFSVAFLLYVSVLFFLLAFLIHQSKPALQLTWGKSSSRDGNKAGENIITPRSRRLLLSQITRVSVSVLSGVIAGQLFFLAAIMRLLHDESGSNVWTYPVTYICILGAIGTALLGLYLLNAALKVEDAVVVIYLYEASYIISGAVSGLCFFQDMSNMAAWHYVIYSLSLVLILLGIYVVAKRESPEEEERDHLLPLLAAPSVNTSGGMKDVSTSLLFKKSAYYASSKSSSPCKQKQFDTGDDKRRRSFPYPIRMFP